MGCQGDFNVMPNKSGMERKAVHVISTVPGREMHPEVVENNVIVGDKVTAHSANTIWNVVQYMGWGVLQQLPYCAVLIPCDYDVIP